MLALASLIAFAFQGSRGLFETTEARYAEAGREMLETGNWFIPQLEHQPHLTKPPMTYWALAGGMALLGQNEWGARLYLALAFVAMVGAVYRIAWLLWDQRTAIVAGSLYACAPAAVYGLYSVSTDQLLALFELLMVLSYCQLWRGEGGHGVWRVWFWLCTGLAFMTKGPLPLLLVAALLTHSHYLRRKGLANISLFRGPGPWLGAVVGLSWFLVLLWRDPGLWSFFLGQEVYGRLFTDQHHRNPHWYGPFAVYLPVLLFGLGPVMLCWLWPAKQLPWKALPALVKSKPSAVLLAVWILVPLVVLSISRSRLPLYVLPLFPAVVLATARILVLWCKLPRAEVRLRYYIVTMAVLMIAIKGVAAHVEVRADSRRLSREVLKHKPANALCVIFQCEALYGLDFYLSGQVERVHKPEAVSSEPTAAAELRNACSRHPACHSVLFVTDSGHGAEGLRSLVAALQLEITGTWKLDWYSLVLVNLPGAGEHRAAKP